MNLSSICHNVDCHKVQGGDVDISAITIDSRKAGKGSLFVCFQGLHVDAHDFIPQAVKNGVSAIVVEKELKSFPPGIPVIKVENARKALSFLAGNFYGNPQDKLNIVGITGTNGKTSSAYFMQSLLMQDGRKTGMIGTVETRIGKDILDIPFATSTTPDSVELMQILAKMVDEGVTDVVMEVTSHSLALHKVDAISFALGIFTNLTQDHLDLHGSMENYKNIKMRLFQQCGKGVINGDDVYGQDFLSSQFCPMVSYGIEKPADVKAEQIQYLMEGIRFDVSWQGKKYPFSVPIPGKFTAYNCLGVIAGALTLGIPMESIQNKMAAMEPVPGRIENLAQGYDFAVIVDYAHTPDGLENIIQAVREFTKGKVITIFGCGGDRDRTKRPIMGEIAARLSDMVIITSDNPRTEDPAFIMDEVEAGARELSCPYEKIADRRAAILKGVALAEPGDTVVVAGKGHEDYQIFATETIHFDDREVVREALEDRR